MRQAGQPSVEVPQPMIAERGDALLSHVGQEGGAHDLHQPMAAKIAEPLVRPADDCGHVTLFEFGCSFAK